MRPQCAEILKNRYGIIYSANTFYNYADGYYKAIEEETIVGFILNIFGNTFGRNACKEIIYFLQSKAFVPHDDLNPSNILNLKNGILDINKIELLEHSPKYYFTTQLNVSYKEEAKCPLWTKTLDEILSKEKVEVLQEFFGLCLTSETKYEKALFCIGGGANGKSVVLSVLEKIIGVENFSAVSLEKFSNSFYLAQLFGKLVNISIETHAKSEIYDSAFKAIVSGDSITADHKYSKPIKFNPICKLIFSTNNMPRVNDKTPAFFRRLILLRFLRKFEEHEQNENLKYELWEELDGILLWALVG